MLFFFFQAEDGIRDLTVTGVQTCALPIWRSVAAPARHVEQVLAGGPQGRAVERRIGDPQRPHQRTVRLEAVGPVPRRVEDGETLAPLDLEGGGEASLDLPGEIEPGLERRLGYIAAPAVGEPRHGVAGPTDH